MSCMQARVIRCNASLAFVLMASGYNRNALPEIVVEGQSLPQGDIAHDPLTGQLMDRKHNSVLQGLFGWVPALPVNRYCSLHEDAQL